MAPPGAKLVFPGSRLDGAAIYDSSALSVSRSAQGFRRCGLLPEHPEQLRLGGGHGGSGGGGGGGVGGCWRGGAGRRTRAAAGPEEGGDRGPGARELVRRSRNVRRRREAELGMTELSPCGVVGSLKRKMAAGRT